MGSSYTVFIDESFDGFMNLSKENGYFCYAALMVPSAKLPDLERFWAANRNRLVADYKRATGFEIQGEFKSGFLNKLSFQNRRTFGDRLSSFLHKNGCFVAGFYTTVRNMLMYHLRTEVAKNDEVKELPANWESLLAVVKQKLLDDKAKQPGDGHLLVGLFHQTLSITMNWLGSGNQSFAVVYDPRQKKEDTFLIQHADEWLKREAEIKQLLDVYKGATAAIDSSQSPGLMLVDLILRDVRFLFSDVPELLSEQSSTKLVLPVSQTDDAVVMRLNGRLLKWGDRRPMSQQLKLRLRSASLNSMLPLYFDRLAGGKISCEAAFGESRVVNFGLGCLEDMVD